MDLAESGSRSSLSAGQLFEVAEPIDFEECVSQRRGASAYETASSGSPRRLMDFPADDIEVRIVHREHPTIESPIPVDLDMYENQTFKYILSFRSSE